MTDADDLRERLVRLETKMDMLLKEFCYERKEHAKVEERIDRNEKDILRLTTVGSAVTFILTIFASLAPWLHNVILGHK